MNMRKIVLVGVQLDPTGSDTDVNPSERPFCTPVSQGGLQVLQSSFLNQAMDIPLWKWCAAEQVRLVSEFSLAFSGWTKDPGEQERMN